MKSKPGALFLCFAALAAADNYPRQPGIDVQHYTFRVTLADDTGEISGHATVSIRFVREGVTSFALDLAGPAKGKGMTVSEVSSTTPLTYAQESDRLRITLAAAPQAGELRGFEIKYHGIPAGGLHVLKNIHGERTIFSNNWPNLAHQWLPVIDHPYDKASSEFIVTAPAKYQVVSNGRLIEQVDLGDGRRTTHWLQAIPIPVWLDQIGVAQFASRRYGRAAGIPLQTWVFHQDRDAGIATFEEPTRQAIEFFADHIGPYPYAKLAAVQAAGMGGGMEVASAIFYGEKSVTGRPAFGLVAHETAHQWFGDSVTEKDWDDVWLSEGFATYFALLATEHYQGRDAFVAGLKRSRAAIFRAEEKLPGVAVVQTKPWTGIPNAIVYQKGAWALHMLRGQIGTEKFWAGIREYYRRFRDGNASTADFRRVMEETSGQDLGWFFDQWLYRSGSPVLEGGWQYDSSAKRVIIELKQTQAGALYRLPLEIGVPSGPDSKMEKIELTQKQQHFEIPSETPPASVVLDPNTWLLIHSVFAAQ